jgi:hypothetical protein
MAPLLYFSNLAARLSDPTESSLTLLARGLGLRSLICTLLKVFDSPNSLVLISKNLWLIGDSAVDVALSQSMPLLKKRRVLEKNWA